MMLVMEYLSEGDLWEHLNNNQEKYGCVYSHADPPHMHRVSVNSCSY